MKEILFLNPIFKHNIWGGSKLRTEYGYSVNGDDIGECWGIAAHEHGDCTIRDGRYQGLTLSQLWRDVPGLFGNYKSERFPLLVKIIDAKDDLSIQVHPDDSYAACHEAGSYGKTECWYILDCKADATIVIGHNAGTKDELQDMINQGRWSELIREIPIQKGDFLQIDPGTVHAIKGGTLILECQQNSDITYRVYDYDRLSDGKPRELHIQKSIDVITVPAKEICDSVRHMGNMPKNELVEWISCKYYRVFGLDIDEKVTIDQTKAFLLMTVVEGAGTVDGYEVKKGDHFIISSDYGDVIVEGKIRIVASMPV